MFETLKPRFVNTRLTDGQVGHTDCQTGQLFCSLDDNHDDDDDVDDEG